MTDLNKKFAELVGREIADFKSDPRLVLREMDRQPKGALFYASLIYSSDFEAIDDDGYIPRHYMLDTTGKLRDAAIEFMEGKK